MTATWLSAARRIRFINLRRRKCGSTFGPRRFRLWPQIPIRRLWRSHRCHRPQKSRHLPSLLCLRVAPVSLCFPGSGQLCFRRSRSSPGRDSRPSGALFAKYPHFGLRDQGARVFDVLVPILLRRPVGGFSSSILKVNVFLLVVRGLKDRKDLIFTYKRSKFVDRGALD